MPLRTKVFFAIFQLYGGVFEHWGLYLEGPRLPDKYLLHVIGGSQNFNFESKQVNAYHASSLTEIVKLCEVDASKTAQIKERAESIVIHNEHPGYNCQNYVLDLLDDLETEGIRDAGDEEYVTKKDYVKEKVEGLP